MVAAIFKIAINFSIRYWFQGITRNVTILRNQSFISSNSCTKTLPHLYSLTLKKNRRKNCKNVRNHKNKECVLNTNHFKILSQSFSFIIIIWQISWLNVFSSLGFFFLAVVKSYNWIFYPLFFRRDLLSFYLLRNFAYLLGINPLVHSSLIRGS